MAKKKTAREDRMSSFAVTANGAEPKFVLGEVTDKNYSVKLQKALTWYALESSADKSKEWFLLSSDYPKDYRKIKETEFGNIGFIVRLTQDRGFPEMQFIKEAIAKKVEHLDSVLKKYIIKDEERSAKKVKKAPTVDFILIDALEAVDHYVDSYVLGEKKPELDINTVNLNRTQQNTLKAYVEKNLLEFENAHKVKDQDGDNAYNLTASQCKAMAIKFRELLNILNVTATAKVRKIRDVKAKPIGKIVEKVKYLSAWNEYKGLTPDKVIGTAKVLAFHVKSRKAIIFVSSDEKGFSFSGTTLINVNDTESKSKRLRKPEEQVKTLESASKLQIDRIFDRISAGVYPPRTRISEEVIFLKAW